MKKYKVIIRETLEREVRIDGSVLSRDCPEEAKEYVRKKYIDEAYILDWDNHVGTEFIVCDDDEEEEEEDGFWG